MRVIPPSREWHKGAKITPMKHLLRIGVLRGGPSSEYDVSLKTGSAVMNAIKQHHEDKYQARDIFIDRSGIAHIDGQAIDLEELATKVDVVFNALHGAYGEDGKVQHFLEIHGIPFTGSGSLGSAVGMNKILAKNVFKDHGIKSPYWKEVLSADVDRDADMVATDLFRSFLLSAIVKPASSGSSVGISVVRAFHELSPALEEAAKHGPSKTQRHGRRSPQDADRKLDQRMGCCQ